MIAVVSSEVDGTGTVVLLLGDALALVHAALLEAGGLCHGSGGNHFAIEYHAGAVALVGDSPHGRALPPLREVILWRPRLLIDPVL